MYLVQAGRVAWPRSLWCAGLKDRLARRADCGGLHLRAIFLEPGFEYSSGQTLVHPCSARCALKPTSMRFPSMMVVCPRFAALVDQVFFVLLRLFALVPRCFLVYVVRVVFVDLAKPLHCMLIDQLVVLIQGFLPFLLSGIVKCLGSFPGCQGRISLAATKLRFVSRSIRCSGVSADVPGCYSAEVLTPARQGCLGMGLGFWSDAMLPRPWQAGQ